MAGSANARNGAGSLNGPKRMGDVGNNVFECSGERALLLLAARRDRDGGATMCKHTDPGGDSSVCDVRKML